MSLYEPERSNYTIKTHTKYTFDIEKITEYIDSQVSNFVQAGFDTAGLTQLTFCRRPVYWTRELLVTPFAPKYPLSHFERQGMNIFLSKKKPLLICAVIANQTKCEEALKISENVKFYPEFAEPGPGEEEQQSAQHLKFLFKYGDDLRQDNLVL